MYPSFDHRYRLRNPGALFPPSMADIMSPRSKGPVFRRSRTEPWREARTRLRAAGLEHGPVEQGGTSSGYFTGVADGAVYRGGLFPTEYRGSLFVGEVSENVVHRRLIQFPANRVEPTGIRSEDEQDREFLASSDNWFRPVQISNGPGGALYICDMYRELVEAWHTIPEYIQKHLDPESGKDHGRIWRLVPEKGFDPGLPDFDTLNELTAALQSPHGWDRDTAARLLYARRDPGASDLLESALPNATPESQIAILHALGGLGSLRPKLVSPLLRSPHPWVRVHSIRLLESFRLRGDKVNAAVFRDLAGEESHPQVLYQLAFSLGSFSGDADTIRFFREIAGKLPGDLWFSRAVASSVQADSIPEMLAFLIDQNLDQSELTLALAREAGRLQIWLPNETFPLAEMPEKWVFLLHSYAAGLRASRSSLAKVAEEQFVGTLRMRCREVSADPSVEPKIRRAALELLPRAGMPANELRATVFSLMEPGAPAELQNAALSVFRSNVRGTEAGRAVLARLGRADAALRPQLISLLTRRAEWQSLLLDALESRTIEIFEISAADASFLRERTGETIARRSRQLLPAPPDRKAVVARFQSSLTLKGAAAAGEKIFRERCLVCHRLGSEGGPAGPAAGEFQKHGKGQILLNMLDPNKTIQPDYIAYVITTKGGETVTGRILENNAASIVLLDPAGNRRELPQSEIQKAVATGRSLMPEGLEAGLSNRDMADLLEFIASFGQ